MKILVLIPHLATEKRHENLTKLVDYFKTENSDFHIIINDNLLLNYDTVTKRVFRSAWYESKRQTMLEYDWTIICDDDILLDRGTIPKLIQHNFPAMTIEFLHDHSKYFSSAYIFSEQYPNLLVKLFPCQIMRKVDVCNNFLMLKRETVQKIHFSPIPYEFKNVDCKIRAFLDMKKKNIEFWQLPIRGWHKHGG